MSNFWHLSAQLGALPLGMSVLTAITSKTSPNLSLEDKKWPRKKLFSNFFVFIRTPAPSARAHGSSTGGGSDFGQPKSFFFDLEKFALARAVQRTSNERHPTRIGGGRRVGVKG